MDEQKPQPPTPPAIPLPYYAAAAVPRMPLSVSILCWINIIRASIGLLSVPCGSVTLLVLTPFAQAIAHSPLVIGWYVIAGVATLALSTLLLIGSIRALRLQERGRKLMICYAWVELAYGFIVQTLSITILPKFIPAALQPQTVMAGQGQFVHFMRVVMPAVAYIYIAAWVAWILIVMTRPYVKEAFASQLPQRDVIAK